MPLPPRDRQKATYTLLSTQPNSPRGVIVGRHDTHSKKYIENNSTPGPNNYQSLKVWSADPNRKGARIGTQSMGSTMANPRIQYSPDSMLGSTLRSKSIDAPIYDAQPGMGDWNPRKGAAVMCGNHGRYAANSSSAAANSTDGTFDGSVAPQPGPQSYASDYGTMGAKARRKKMESLHSLSACTFGRRWGSENKSKEGMPGPGTYENTDYSKTMSPYPPDENPRGLYGSRTATRASARSRTPRDRDSQQGGVGGSGSYYNNSRPGTTSAYSPYQTDSSRGKSMSDRWKDHRPETSPGPGEYSPRLPFISASNSRVPSLKGRLAHPFVDTLAAHDCAKSDFNHSSRGASRMKARVTAT